MESRDPKEGTASLIRCIAASCWLAGRLEERNFFVRESKNA